MSFRSSLLSIAAFCLTLIASIAHADATMFTLTNVTLQTGFATGNITIDTGSGTVTSGTIDLFNGTSYFLFNIVDGTTNNTDVDTYVDFLDAGGDIYQLSVPPLTLVGYQGSVICTYDVRCSNFTGGFFPNGVINGPGSDYNATGSLTPPATPEPSSIILLGTGLLGVAGAARHKFCTT